ncbi:MAG TPA: sensor histidine kinase [Usitatibacteraceae bacterium]|nr:sensor histidine kinase [Usitatibacteraceae bacterium]
MSPAEDAAAIRALEIEARRNNEKFHPLELIPVFRRWPQSLGRDLVYTFIWNSLIGFTFAGIAIMFGSRPSWRMFNEVLLFSNCIGYTIHLLFFCMARSGAERWVNQRGKLVIMAYYTAVPSAGVFLGILLASAVLGRDLVRMLGSPSWMLVVMVNAVIISLIIGVIYFWREKSMVAEMRIAAERERMAHAERAATLANLRTLQAQIEPHFLFNTLANVAGLIHPQPETAKRMLERFIAYLRASLAASRESATTLEADFELMRNFLEILRIRMGDRLTVECDLPDALRGVSVPPMLLQPLVENAIKHGLEPKIEGGTLSLVAREAAAGIEIVIADTGAGFSGATSQGVGLRNVRERLEKIYDGRAALRIEDNIPCGTRVVISLPRGEKA